MSDERITNDAILRSILDRVPFLIRGFEQLMKDPRIKSMNPGAPLDLFTDAKVFAAIPHDILISLNSSITLNWNTRPDLSEMPDSGVIYGYSEDGDIITTATWWRSGDEFHSSLTSHDPRHAARDMIHFKKPAAEYAPFHGMPHIMKFLELAKQEETDFTSEDMQGIPLIRYVKPEGVTQQQLDSLPEFHLSPRALPDYLRKFRMNKTPTRRHNESIWWVSEDLSGVVWDTVLSGTTPDNLLDEDVAAEAGIMFFDGGEGLPLPCIPLYGPEAGTVQFTTINAVAWSYDWDLNAARINPEVKGKLNFFPISAKVGAFESFHDNSTEHLMMYPIAFADWSLDHIIGFSHSYVSDLAEKLVKTALRLSREEFVGERQVTELLPVTKSEIKKAKRSNKKPDTVVVALLRKPKNQPVNELRDSQGREYSHRWIVRGHTRKQPFGKIEDGKRQVKHVWIAPYVKGPADKPLIIKDKVLVWKR